MRSILLQSCRVGSRAHLAVLPRPPSSSLLRRSNSTTSPPDANIAEPSSHDASSPLQPSLLEHPPTSSPSQLPSSHRLPPPPLDDSFSSRPITSQPSSATAASPKSKSSSGWWGEQWTDRHQAQAIALAVRLEADGSEALVGTPQFVAEVHRLFTKVSKLARASDDHLRALSTIYQAVSTSPAAIEDDGRGSIRKHSRRRLLFLFTRRLNIKSTSLLPSLRPVLEAGLDDLDLLLSREAFRQLAVGLASGGRDASEAVEIVKGLRRRSPASFTEVEFKELVQAIGRVEDWTATTPETFHLLSFPAPLRPLPSPPRPASPPTPLSRASTPTKPSQPTSSHSTSSSSTKKQVVPPISPPSSSNNNAQAEELLQFSRAGLFNAPPPSADNLQFIYNLFKAAFPQPHDVANQARTEVAVRILVHASRAPPLPPQDRYRFAGLVSVVLHSIENLPFVDLDSFGLNVKKDLLSLVGRSVKRGQVRSLTLFLYKSQRRDFEEEELKTVFGARDGLPDDDRHLRALQIDEDWEKGFGARLGETMEEASSSSNRSSSETLNTDTDVEWIEWSKQVLHREPYLKREVSYGLLRRRSIRAPSSSESLIVASNLYSRYAPSNSGVPHKWRQHGNAIVRMLLLFSNHPGATRPPFKLLEPVLRHLPLLPPSFIPSTPSFPSFAIPLLPMTTTPDESFLILKSILHAQEVTPTSLLEIWSTFLSSLERHSASPTANGIFASKLFSLVQTQASLKENRTGPSPLEDVVQMYLRRVESKDGERAKGEELKGLEKLERLVTEREEGRERAESMKSALAQLRRLLETKKV